MSTPEIGLYPDATPDEQIAYSMGWNTATAIARTEAFAAIRRAVWTARHFDAKANSARKTLAHRTPETDVAVAIATVDTSMLIADSVRYSIRCAIGSEKA